MNALLIALLRSTGGISSKDLSARTGMTRSAAAAKLHYLHKTGAVARKRDYTTPRWSFLYAAF